VKVYTKKGDQGTTGLIGGTRVLKNSLRIEAYGTVDELNSHIGMLRDVIENVKITEQLLEIQDRLFTMGSLMAADPIKSRMKLPSLTLEDIHNLEMWIDEMDEEIEPMKSFVLPGGHTTVSQCHITRCVCRRAERIAVNLNQTEPIDGTIIKYLNRLSDYIFTLGRKLAHDLKIIEKPWKARL